MSKDFVPYNLKFPEAVGRFWMLNWFGRISPGSEKYSYNVELHFVNVQTHLIGTIVPSSLQRSINIVPLAHLLLYKIGDLYSQEGTKCGVIQRPHEKTSAITLPGKFNPAKKINGLESAISSFFLPDKEYLKDFGAFLIKIGDQNLILPVIELCRSLFFKDSRTIRTILKYPINSYIPAEPIFENDDQGKLTGKLYYDNQFPLKTIEAIAPYFFIDQNQGKTSVSLLRNLLNKRIREQSDSNKPGVYLVTPSPFVRPIKITLKTVEIVVGQSTMLLATSITDIKVNADNGIPQEIELIPMIPRDSTADRYNHTPENKIILSGLPSKNLLKLSNEEHSTNTTNETKNAAIDNFFFHHQIEIKHHKRTEQVSAYNITNKDQGSPERLSTGDNKNSYSDSAELNLINEKVVMHREEYLTQCLTLLKEIHGIDYYSLPNGGSIKFVKENYLQAIFVELRYQKGDWIRNYYLVEFGRGYTLLFSYRDFRPIHYRNLLKIATDYLRKAKDLKKFLDNKKPIFQRAFPLIGKDNIIMHERIEHQSKNSTENNLPRILSDKVWGRIQRTFKAI